MIVDPISRTDGKLLRRLAGVAYERELARELDRLSAAFDKWKEKQLSAHDVSAAIHEFHDGVARDLYVLYNRIHPAQTVPRAVAAGLLAEHEVPADLLLKLAKTLDFYRSEFATVERESSPIP